MNATIVIRNLPVAGAVVTFLISQHIDFEMRHFTNGDIAITVPEPDSAALHRALADSKAVAELVGQTLGDLIAADTEAALAVAHPVFSETDPVDTRY